MITITEVQRGSSYAGSVVIDMAISVRSGQSRPPDRVPQATLRRLAQYHHLLVTIARTGATRISCSVIGEALSCVPVQVRKDLQHTGIVGKPKTGYAIHELIGAIESCLGWNRVNEAVLVGVGHLGTALLGYESFTGFGLKIVAAFDNDPNKIGITVSNKPVLPFSGMASLVQSRGIRLGIITTPAGPAQSVADEMVRGGILAIWNFAPVNLHVPTSVVVHNEDLYSSLAALSSQLARRLQGSL